MRIIDTFIGLELDLDADGIAIGAEYRKIHKTFIGRYFIERGGRLSEIGQDFANRLITNAE